MIEVAETAASVRDVILDSLVSTFGDFRYSNQIALTEPGIKTSSFIPNG